MSNINKKKGATVGNISMSVRKNILKYTYGYVSLSK